MSRGGKRPNSGPKRGAKYAPTLAKERAREVAREIITRRLEPILKAQVANAVGLKYLVTRDKRTGKVIRVGAAMAGRRHEETIEVWEKDPSVEACRELLNRALDKAAEQPQAVKHAGEVSLRWLE